MSINETDNSKFNLVVFDLRQNEGARSFFHVEHALFYLVYQSIFMSPF